MLERRLINQLPDLCVYPRRLHPAQLAGQLTCMERSSSGPSIQAMTTTTHHASSPHPAGATEVCDWYDLQYPEDAGPYFTDSSWVVECDDREDIAVFIDGIQRLDGRVNRLMHVHQLHADDSITPSHAQQLARALIAAADDVEAMSSYDDVEVNR